MAAGPGWPKLRQMLKPTKGIRSMNTRIRSSIAGLAALAAATLAVAVQPAVAAPSFDSARFKVSVKGTQVSSENIHRDADGPCDTSDYSTSGEKVRFKSAKPVILTAFSVDDGPVSFSNKRTGNLLPVRATIDRFHNPHITPAAAECEDNGGGVEGGPTLADCGVKKAPWKLGLEYLSERREIVGFYDTDGTDPYNNCPGGINLFPFMPFADGNAEPVGSELPRTELFDDKIGKLILIGKGQYKDLGMTYSSIVDLRWELTLKRLADPS